MNLLGQMKGRTQGICGVMGEDEMRDRPCKRELRGRNEADLSRDVGRLRQPGCRFRDNLPACAHAAPSFCQEPPLGSSTVFWGELAAASTVAPPCSTDKTGAQSQGSLILPQRGGAMRGLCKEESETKGPGECKGPQHRLSWRE